MRFSDTPACVGIDTELFFTEDQGGAHSNLYYVKKMCNNCPVRVECFDYAIENLVHGLWAGTSKEERDKYRRKHNIVGKTVVPISIFNSNYE